MDFEGRIRELAKTAGVGIENPERCWVDGHINCPYGSPEGQYILRPTVFCGNKCRHFADNSVELFTHEDIADMADDELRGHFNEHHVTLTSQLEATAEYMAEKRKPAERLVLLLAVDIIEENKQDADILLREKLPE